MNSMYPLQKKLFELTSQKCKDKVSEMERYVSTLRLSRTAIYERIRGNVPISLDEANTLLHAFDISWEQLVGVANTQNLRPAITLVRSIQTAPEEYIKLLYRDIVHFGRLRDAYTWQECADVPVFWLKYSRSLAGFNLYFWSKAFHLPQPSEPFPLFSMAWMQHHSVAKLLHQSKEILTSYQAVPGLEIWTKGMFDLTISRIRYLYETGNFACKDLVTRLFEEVMGVARQMERMAHMGNKAPDGSGKAMQVYENRTFSPANTLCGISLQRSFLYVDVGYPNFMRYDTPALVEERVSRFPLMLRHLEPITNSERGMNTFFRAMYDHIEPKLAS